MSVDAGFPVKIPTSLAELSPDLISQGAEALTFIVDNPFAEGEKCVAKYRPPKPYRISEVDAPLRKKRTNAEARVLETLLQKHINSPKLIRVDGKDAIIYMSFIDGKTLKQATWDSTYTAVTGLYKALGSLVARLHSLDIVHGDLTTSNVMVDNGELTLIDFGLASRQASVEDKAVDIYVLERAVESTHPEHSKELVKEIMDGYIETGSGDKQHPQVMSRLDKVRLRGRKRTMIG